MDLSSLADAAEPGRSHQSPVEVEQQHMDWKVAAELGGSTPDQEYSGLNWTA